MACDPATLIAAAKCWFSCGDRAQNDAIEIVFLCAIRDGDTSIVCDPATLQAQAQCILQCIPQGMMAAVKLGLLCSIAANGGGGGGGTCSPSGIGSPEGVITANVGCFYSDISNTAAPGLWVKTSGAGNTGWTNLIAVGP